NTVRHPDWHHFRSVWSLIRLQVLSLVLPQTISSHPPLSSGPTSMPLGLHTLGQPGTTMPLGSNLAKITYSPKWTIRSMRSEESKWQLGKEPFPHLLEGQYVTV